MKINDELLEQDIDKAKQLIQKHLPNFDPEKIKATLRSIPHHLAHGFEVMKEDIKLDLEDTRNGNLPWHLIHRFKDWELGRNVKMPHHVVLAGYFWTILLVGRYTKGADAITEIEKKELTDADFLSIEDNGLLNNQELVNQIPIEFYSSVLIDDEFEFEIVGDNNENDTTS